MGAWFMEDKTKVLSFARRVSPKYQGRGLMKKAMALLNELLRKQLSQPYSIEYTADFDPRVHPPHGILKNTSVIHKTWVDYI